MKTTVPLALLALLLLATAVQAQRRVTVGPRVGLNRTGTSTAFHRADQLFQPTARLGWEAGVQGAFALGHVALQPALLYAQTGFEIDEAFGPTVSFDSPTHIHERYRFNYLTLPLNLVYTQHVDGAGLQVFGGGYMGRLLGGNYVLDNRYAMFPSGSALQQKQGKIRTRTRSSNSGSAAENRYAPRWDAGVQTGVGYRLGRALLQVSYSWGTRHLSTQEVYTAGTTVRTYEVARHRNRALQAWLTYWLNRKR